MGGRFGLGGLFGVSAKFSSPSFTRHGAGLCTEANSRRLHRPVLTCKDAKSVIYAGKICQKGFLIVILQGRA
jgi:hypothetical protein